MKKRKLGKTGLETAPLVVGGNVFGWTIDQATSFTLLDAFVAAGFNSIDTADVYSKWVPGHAGGESEIIIGEWMKQRGNRNKIIVATKVGMDMGDGKKGLAKSYVLRSADDSLRRLQTDYIDLYQSHIDDPDTPLDMSRRIEAHMTSDRPGMIMRRRLLKLLEDHGEAEVFAPRNAGAPLAAVAAE